MVIDCINDETHHDSTLLLYWEISGTHAVNNIMNQVEKYICKKKICKEKRLQLPVTMGKNTVKSLRDLVIMYIRIFIFTLQFYVQGIIVAHSRETELLSTIISKMVS